MTLRRWLTWAAILGLVAPAVWFSLGFALDGIPGWAHEKLMWMWPTSLLLLLTAGREQTPESFAIISVAILGNVVLYGLVGIVAWIVRRNLSN